MREYAHSCYTDMQCWKYKLNQNIYCYDLHIQHFKSMKCFWNNLITYISNFSIAIILCPPRNKNNPKWKQIFLEKNLRFIIHPVNAMIAAKLDSVVYINFEKTQLKKDVHNKKALLYVRLISLASSGKCRFARISLIVIYSLCNLKPSLIGIKF